MTPETRTCQNCKNDFIIEPDDFTFYEKIKVPPPTWCPDCRVIRRMTWWNERNLFKKKDAHDGKEIFSMYPPQSKWFIYEHNYWWSDAWDPMKYARDYDFSRSFFEQFNELLLSVPHSSREIKSLENSDYSNNSSHLKNCYLCFDSDFNENCMYSAYFRECHDTLDVFNVKGLELCYELLSSAHCYQCAFSIDIDNCRGVWFSRNCENCEDCFGCVNLRHKKYCFFNEQLSRDQYKQKIKELDLGSYKNLRDVQNSVNKFWRKHPYRFMHGTHNTNVSGDYLEHCKDVKLSFETYECQRVKYSQRIVNHSSEIWDSTSWGDNSQLVYETAVCGENNLGIKFCAFCWPGNREIEYCVHCHSSSNLFGCVGLSKKEFCILNKQYNPEEYQSLRTQIVEKMKKDGEYGEFFPSHMSPFAYNESIAIDYFPLDKEEATGRGFSWIDPEHREYEITISADKLPDHIRDAKQEVTSEIIQCLRCKRAYRLLERELEFYQRLMIPLPRLCHNCRHQQRLKQRNPLNLWNRKCDKCDTNMETSYSPERPEIVYCEQCYNAEVA